MGKTRLEAFSDGVIAILITIMVLELKVPEEASWLGLRGSAPILLVYLLSFVLLAIYWNNHHHMFHTVDRVNGKILWANMHLLFWLSTIPFATAWMGENHFARMPSALYGIVLFMAAIAYKVLQQAIIAAEGPGSVLAAAVGGDWKGKLSPVLYLVAIASTFWLEWVALALYMAVALLWLVPDPRIEQALRHKDPA